MIGGFEPCSLIDFPGHLAAAVFLRGCNMRCPYCHNAELIARGGPAVMRADDLMAFLARRRGLLDGVVFSGGEPTLARELRSLVERARGMGYAIKLDTNGTRPDVLAELLSDGLLDYIALDLKDEPAACGEWLGMRGSPDALVRSLDLVKSSGVEHELRTTVVPGRHDEERLDRMARWATGCRRWILQPCHFTAEWSPSAAPTDDSALEELAARLRARHGVECYARSEIGRLDQIDQTGRLSSPGRFQGPTTAGNANATGGTRQGALAWQ